MSITISAAQFARAANLHTFAYIKKNPIDLVNAERPLLKWFIDNKQEASGNLLVHEKIHFSNDGNFQTFSGADVVSYNSRDTVRLASFIEANAHDGFYIDEGEARQNGITLDDSGISRPASPEDFTKIVDLLDENQRAMRESMLAGLELEAHLSGTQTPKSALGLDGLVSLTPAVGTVGGINRALHPWWRNEANLNIAHASLIDQMHLTYRRLVTFGKTPPTVFFCGSRFLDVYRQQAGLTVNRQLTGTGLQRGGVTVDAGVTGTFFQGIELVWNPLFDQLDAITGETVNHWTRRCYALNPRAITLRPTQGAWMVNRKPARPHDQYIHFFGVTAAYRFTMRNPRALGVLSVAP